MPSWGTVFLMIVRSAEVSITEWESTGNALCINGVVLAESKRVEF